VITGSLLLFLLILLLLILPSFPAHRIHTHQSINENE